MGSGLLRSGCAGLAFAIALGATSATARSPAADVHRLSAAGGHRRSQTPKETRAASDIRGLWVQRSTLTSRARIDQLVRRAADNGFNTLFLQVRARGDALFAGSIEPRGPEVEAGFDPFGHAIDSAHRAGLQVHAWINVNLVASATTLPTDRAHVIHTHPEWLMAPRELAASLATLSPRQPQYVARLAAWTRQRSDRVEGLYVSPIPAGAAHYLESIVADLAARYAIDGLHLDYVRYPGPQFDYSASALEAFRASVLPSLSVAERTALEARRRRNPLAYVDHFPTRWTEYRRGRLADLVARLRHAVKAKRPEASVSAAVVPDAAEAIRDRLQDWPGWARRGLLDAVCPMAYTSSLTRYAEQIDDVTRAAGGRPVWAGVGAWRLTPDQIVRHISAARTAGAHGIVLFSYDSLASVEREPLRAIGRAAFSPAGAPAAGCQ
jgi:uncharacterized lipoprotein YddW (UPF0748 family)